MTTSYRPITILAAGATVNFEANYGTACLLLKPDAGAVTLVGNVTVNFTGTPSDGQIINVQWLAGFTLGANTFTVNGVSLSALHVLRKGSLRFQYIDGAAPVWAYLYEPDLITASSIVGSLLSDSSVALVKISDLTNGTIPVGSAGGVATARTVSGVITLSNTGVTAFVAGSIVNADINAAAAIARTKFANGTANYVLINSAGGVMTEEQYLATSRGGFGVSVAAATGIARVVAGVWSFLSAVTAALGGTGIDSSGSTGIPQVAAGTWSVGAWTDTKSKFVSFAAAGVGTYELLFPFPCTVTSIDVEVADDIAGTDDGTITFQDDSATAMVGNNLTAGVLTVALGSNTGTNFTTTVTANGVFTAGQVMKMITAKVTAGGTMNVTVTYTRLTLS